MNTPYQWRYYDLTGIDLEQYNYRKHSPDLEDDHGFSIQGEYCQRVESAYQYAYDVLAGNIPASSDLIGAVERFIFDLNREDLEMDEDEVALVVLIANSLRHPKGAIAGTQYFLLPWNIFFFANVFGFFYSDKARETLRGDRRFIKSCTFVARGNSKTCLAAVMSIANMLTNDNGSPVGVCAASVAKQAKLAFDDIARMIKSASPTIRKRFEVLRNEIRCPNGGSIIVASRESESLDGIRGSGLQLCDEIHAHPSSAVVDVLSTGMQSSKNPQMLLISTAGVNTQGYGKEMFDYASEVSRNIINNDRFFSLVYAVDKEDYDNWEDESVFAKANPSLHHAVSLEGLKAACEEAKRNAKARANFLTKHLNIWVDFDEDNLVDYSDLVSCKENTLNIEDFKGKNCYLGLDLAGVSDLSSLVYLFPTDDGGVTVFQKSYLPESVLQGLKPAMVDRYYEAHKKGELIFTPSEITDTQYIQNDIVNADKDFNVLGLSIDAAAGGTKFSWDLQESEGIEAVAIKQGFGLSESAILFQTLVKSKKLKYNSDLFEWCVTNALVQTGSQGDVRIIRSKSDHSKKIDIAIATVIGLSQTILKESKESVYEHRDFRTL
ncbi:terminase large subunit [Shewanella oncorhynchi]|uniref:Terminase large subunit n=1 Tax=Shewanella oncorhynchi TaxID=2726434 RepID=A0AA50Q7L4_9GAMM|nr:terminase TerL endonuclease subunit [Shewanella oncorhynchi]WMB74213.1 terminase large subunit [Shewanella oncorhynchi]